VTRCPGRRNRAYSLVSMCSRSPGQGHSAVGRLTRRFRRPGETRPPEHLRDSRVTEAGRAGDQARPPAGATPACADRLGELGRELARRVARTARAIKQTRQRRVRLLAGLEPTVPPTMSSRGRHAERRRGRLQRHPHRSRRPARGVASRASRYGETTSSPPSSRSLARPRPRRRAGYSQPFWR
jgi:hypothetical protein